jgi:hypothetical protein
MLTRVFVQSEDPIGVDEMSSPDSSIPTHWERQLMQRMHDRGRIKSVELPAASRTIKILLERGWIESSGEGKDQVYMITEKGVAAKKARIPPKRDGYGRPRLRALLTP